MDKIVNKIDAIAIDDKTQLRETKPKVLVIGDSPDPLSIAKDNAKRERVKFHEDSKKRLALLIMGNTTDMEYDMDNIDSFGAGSNQINPLTRQYYFECNKPVDNHRTWGHTYDSRAILEAVKQRLNTENWISENIMEIALKAKRGNKFSNIDKCIYDVVSDCLHEQDARIHQFLCFLQQQHRKSN